MNINEYNKKKNNTTANINRKRQQNTQINIPGDNLSKSSRSSRDSSNQVQRKKKKIRIDKIIGYITIITIVIFAAIIYSDVKGTTKANNAQEVLAVNSTESGTKVATVTNANGSKTSNNKIVCIDAGHGGTDGGAQYKSYSEK